VIGIAAAPQPRKKQKRLRTADLIREANVAALSTLREWEVNVVLRQTLLAIMPFVETWWISAAFRLGEAT